MLRGLQIQTITPILSEEEKSECKEVAEFNRFVIGGRDHDSYKIYRVNIALHEEAKVYEFKCLIDVQLQSIVLTHFHNHLFMVVNDSHRRLLIN